MSRWKTTRQVEHVVKSIRTQNMFSAATESLTERKIRQHAQTVGKPRPPHSILGHLHFLWPGRWTVKDFKRGRWINMMTWTWPSPRFKTEKKHQFCKSDSCWNKSLDILYTVYPYGVFGVWRAELQGVFAKSHCRGASFRFPQCTGSPLLFHMLDLFEAVPLYIAAHFLKWHHGGSEGREQTYDARKEDSLLNLSNQVCVCVFLFGLVCSVSLSEISAVTAGGHCSFYQPGTTYEVFLFLYVSWLDHINVQASEWDSPQYIRHVSVISERMCDEEKAPLYDTHMQNTHK